MSRPTRFCEKCGEYVAERPVTNVDWSGRAIVTVERLVHIDADGKIIHRNHEPREKEQA